MKRMLILIMIAVPIISCGQSVPGWVKNPPKSNDKIYAVGIGTSGSAEIAERKAKMEASVNLAEQLETAVVSVTTKFEPVVRRNKALTEKVKVVRKTVVATLQNTQVSQKFATEENGIHKVYVLMEMPRKNVNRSIIDEIEKDEELHKALSNSKAYKKVIAEQ